MKVGRAQRVVGRLRKPRGLVDLGRMGSYLVRADRPDGRPDRLVLVDNR